MALTITLSLDEAITVQCTVDSYIAHMKDKLGPVYEEFSSVRQCMELSEKLAKFINSSIRV
jgi:hypothetical protein